MVKKKAKPPAKPKIPSVIAIIGSALRKQTKEELVALLLGLAKNHYVVTRELEAKLKIEKPVELLIADIASSIDRATDFDEDDRNCNFDVDSEEYERVQKGLSLLVQLGHLEAAKSLALKLMEYGSLQVEGSDEGLMSDEICDCLKPVIKAVKVQGGNAAIQWAKKMMGADRIGCICDGELKDLLGKS